MPTTSNFGWTTPADTDLVKDGAAAIRTLGNGIDTSFLDLKGGTSGQVLSKASNTDLDFTWVAQDDSNAIQNAIVDAKGDLITATAADTPARLAVGTNGHILTADSTTATGLKWAAPAGGGKVLQVVEGSTTTVLQTNSTTFVDSNLTATITPSSATSKVLVLVTQNGCGRFGTTAGAKFFIQLLRGATDIGNNADFGLEGNGATGTSTTGNRGNTYALNVLDSPNTTSATTYKTQIKATSGASVECQVYNSSQTCKSTIILMEIGA